MIRKAETSDIPNIKLLMKSVTGFWQEQWRADVLELGMRSSEGLSYVYVEGEKIIAFACAQDLGFRGYLSELVVADSQRKRGIGRKLINKVQSELTDRGCSLVISDVWKNAEQFYIKLGWSPPDVLLMRKKLL